MAQTVWEESGVSSLLFNYCTFLWDTDPLLSSLSADCDWQTVANNWIAKKDVFETDPARMDLIFNSCCWRDWNGSKPQIGEAGQHYRLQQTVWPQGSFLGWSRLNTLVYICDLRKHTGFGQTATKAEELTTSLTRPAWGAWSMEASRQQLNFHKDQNQHADLYISYSVYRLWTRLHLKSVLTLPWRMLCTWHAII